MPHARGDDGANPHRTGPSAASPVRFSLRRGGPHSPLCGSSAKAACRGGPPARSRTGRSRLLMLEHLVGSAGGAEAPWLRRAFARRPHRGLCGLLRWRAQAPCLRRAFAPRPHRGLCGLLRSRARAGQATTILIVHALCFCPRPHRGLCGLLRGRPHRLRRALAC